MSDLTDLQSAQSAKLVGASSTGIEGGFVSDDGEGRLNMRPPAFATVSVDTQISVTNVSTTLLAANANRQWAFIANNSGGTVWLAFGAAAVSNRRITLVSGGLYQLTGINIWTGSVTAIKTGGGSFTIDVFEAVT